MNRLPYKCLLPVAAFSNSLFAHGGLEQAPGPLLALHDMAHALLAHPVWMAAGSLAAIGLFGSGRAFLKHRARQARH